MTLHAVVRDPASGDEAISAITAFLKSRHGVTHVTVQAEHVGCDEPAAKLQAAFGATTCTGSPSCSDSPPRTTTASSALRAPSISIH